MSDEVAELEPWAVGLMPHDAEFVREFMIDMNAMQAGIRSGLYTSPERAQKDAWRTMRRPTIVRAIAMAMHERSEALGITAKTVLGEAFRSYLAAAADKNWPAAARFLEMVGRHVDVRAFREKGGLLGDDEAADEAESLAALSLEDLENLARIRRKLAGPVALPAPAPIRH